MAALEDVESVAYRLEGDRPNPRSCGCPTNFGRPDVLRPSIGIYAAAPATTSSCLASSTYGAGSTIAGGSGETPSRSVTRHCSRPASTSRSTSPSASSSNRAVCLAHGRRCLLWTAIDRGLPIRRPRRTVEFGLKWVEPPSSGSVTVERATRGGTDGAAAVPGHRCARRGLVARRLYDSRDRQLRAPWRLRLGRIHASRRVAGADRDWSASKPGSERPVP